MSLPVTKKDPEGDFLIIASGQIRVAPYLSGWQEFKDQIRKVVKDQPGWTNVIDGSKRGEKQGWCKLKDPEDADAFYNLFSRRIVVHIFSTSLRTGHFELKKCNCRRYFSGVRERGHSPGRSGIDVNSVNQAFCKSGVTPAPPYTMPPQPAYQSAYYYQQILPGPPTPAYVYPVAPVRPLPTYVPMYSQSATGLPVNLSQGAVVTESRGIFIQGLSYTVGNDELQSLIHGVGVRPSKVSVQYDSKGSSKGVATANFANNAEAQYVVSQLNGRTHLGKILAVRMDTNSTVVGSLEPFVVDGTNRSGGVKTKPL